MKETTAVGGKVGRRQMRSEAYVLASACRTESEGPQTCMGVVTGEFCVFMARIQVVPVPPDTAAFRLVKRMYPIGHLGAEPEERGRHSERTDRELGYEKTYSLKGGHQKRV